MSVVVGSNLFNNTWNTVYKIISGNIIDPATRGGSQWIFADYPIIQDGQTDEHPGFPIVTLEPFQSDTEIVTQGIGKSYSELNSVITIFTTNKRQNDVVSSDVWDALNSNRGVLMQSGLSHLSINAGGLTTDALNRHDRIHTKNMGIGFKVEI